MHDNCHRCGAPQCCRVCCESQAQTDRIKELEARETRLREALKKVRSSAANQCTLTLFYDIADKALQENDDES